MIHYLIAVLDNTLPTAVVFSLFLALALRTAGKDGRTFCLQGLLLGLAAALVYSVLKRNTGIAVREYYDLGTHLPSLAGILFLLLCPRRTLPLEKASGSASSRLCLTLLPAAWAAAVLPNLLLYPFEFAVGMPSVYNLDFLSRIAGYCLGLLLVLLLSFSLCSAAGKFPRRLLFALCALCLLILFASQGLALARILITRNLIPRFPWVMSLVLLDIQNGFAFALMGLTLFLAFLLMARLRHEPISGSNPAQRRKQKAAQRKQKGFLLLIFICLLASALSLTLLRRYENREAEISPPTEVFSVNGFIVLPLDTINDGNLHRFVYTVKDGTGIRFIVIKKSNTAYGVGLDACDICGPTGYFQRKDQVICKLCDVVMNKATIGFPGGCNPVPIAFSLSQGALLIRIEDLEAEKDRFKNG